MILKRFLTAHHQQRTRRISKRNMNIAKCNLVHVAVSQKALASKGLSSSNNKNLGQWLLKNLPSNIR
jgi:hypothetical protein